MGVRVVHPVQGTMGAHRKGPYPLLRGIREGILEDKTSKQRPRRWVGVGKTEVVELKRETGRVLYTEGGACTNTGRQEEHSTFEEPREVQCGQGTCSGGEVVSIEAAEDAGV